MIYGAITNLCILKNGIHVCKIKHSNINKDVWIVCAIRYSWLVQGCILCKLMQQRRWLIAAFDEWKILQKAYVVICKFNTKQSINYINQYLSEEWLLRLAPCLHRNNFGDIINLRPKIDFTSWHDIHRNVVGNYD